MGARERKWSREKEEIPGVTLPGGMDSSPSVSQGKERIESLGGNWSGFKIKLREVRDGGREGKRELRSAFNDDFFLSCSFHILSFLGGFS